MLGSREDRVRIGLLDDPAGVHDRDLVGHLGDECTVEAGLYVTAGTLITLPNGCSFHPRCPYVREAHKKIDPHLVGTAESADGGRHRVACLLPPQTRRALWSELGQGATPVEAKERVTVPEEAVDTEAAR